MWVRYDLDKHDAYLMHIYQNQTMYVLGHCHLLITTCRWCTSILKMYDSKLAHRSQKLNIFSVFPSVTNDVQAMSCSRKKQDVCRLLFISIKEWANFAKQMLCFRCTVVTYVYRNVCSMCNQRWAPAPHSAILPSRTRSHKRAPEREEKRAKSECTEYVRKKREFALFPPFAA